MRIAARRLIGDDELLVYLDETHPAGWVKVWDADVSSDVTPADAHALSFHSVDRMEVCPHVPAGARALGISQF